MGCARGPRAQHCAAVTLWEQFKLTGSPQPTEVAFHRPLPLRTATLHARARGRPGSGRHERRWPPAIARIDGAHAGLTGTIGFAAAIQFARRMLRSSAGVDDPRRSARRGGIRRRSRTSEWQSRRNRGLSGSLAPPGAYQIPFSPTGPVPELADARVPGPSGGSKAPRRMSGAVRRTIQRS